MTKPKPAPDIIIAIRIPRALDATLAAIARAEDRSRSYVIRLAIREYLDKRRKS